MLRGPSRRTRSFWKAANYAMESTWPIRPLRRRHLASGSHQPPGPPDRNILNFPTLPEQFRAATKELFYALLVGELPPGEIRLKHFSIRSAFTCVKKFLDWAHNRGHHTLASMTPRTSSPTNSGCSNRSGPISTRIHRRAAGCSGCSAPACTPTDSVSTRNACTRGRSTTANHPAVSRTPPTAFPRRSSARCWSGRCAGSTTSATTSSPPETNGGCSTPLATPQKRATGEKTAVETCRAAAPARRLPRGGTPLANHRRWRAQPEFPCPTTPTRTRFINRPNGRALSCRR